MGNLNSAEQSLVSLGAALASNSAPCVEHYVSEARRAGYTDPQIQKTLNLADHARTVPAENVLGSAISLPSRPGDPGCPTTPGSEEGQTDEAGRPAAEAKTIADSGSRPSGTDRRCCC